LVGWAGKINHVGMDKATALAVTHFLASCRC
jgi:hypothetical protein